MIMNISKNTFNSLSLEMKIQTSTLHNSKLSSFIALWLPKCDWQGPILGHGDLPEQHSSTESIHMLNIKH